MIAAAARAFLVALVIAMPAMLVPGVDADRTQMAMLLALVAALLTFVEYVSDYPSLIEFRNAPPFNRLRFVALFLTVLVLTLCSRGGVQEDGVTVALVNLGTVVGSALDFPFSPVRLVVLMAPEGATEAQTALLRSHAGLASLVAVCTLIAFVGLVRLLDWPIRRGAFNFWVNLPLFDPTSGDVLERLKRDSHVNVALGFLLPFLIPAVLTATSAYALHVDVTDPMTKIWMLSAWAFLPVTLIMRGVALMRIADLIEEKRRRAYAQQAELQPA